jgi:Cu+-exporting ATPase
MNDSSCFHCNDVCTVPVIEYDDKQFCCNGCKTVYTIIAENDLTDFYEIESDSGISQKNSSEFNTDFLLEERFTKRYITYQDDDKINATLHIPEIHCNSCIWLLEKLPDLNKYIFSSRVNFLTKELDVSFDSSFSLKQVVELLMKLGYTPTFTLSNKKKDSSYLKSLVLR